MNLKNKLSSLIYYYINQSLHFSTFYMLFITHLINKLEITTNLGVYLTNLIITPTFKLIVKTDSLVCVS